VPNLRAFSLRRSSRRFAQYPLISSSRVEHLESISKTALVRNSELNGLVKVGDYTKVIEARVIGNVIIGRWSSLNGPNTDIWALVNSVKIGNFTSIARNVSIQEYDHAFDRLSSYFIQSNFFGENMRRDIVSKGDILIGNDVWIGAQCVILSGATIGDGAVIGANSVVNSRIPPFAVATGSPTQVVKFRFPEQLVEKLLRLAWWDWDDAKIRRNRAMFEGSLTEEKLDQIV